MRIRQQPRQNHRESGGRLHAAAIEKLLANSSSFPLMSASQAWCPRWQAQDDPGSPSVRAIPFLPAREPIPDRLQLYEWTRPNLWRLWRLTGRQRCHHELR